VLPSRVGSVVRPARFESPVCREFIVANVRVVLAVLICFALSGVKARAAGIDPELQREILAGWAELERSDNARTGIDLTTILRETGGPREGTRSATARYLRSGESSRFTTQTHKGNIEAYVQNSRYLFTLSRVSDSDPWTMSFLEQDLASPGAKQMQDGWLSAKLVAPTAAILLGSSAAQQARPSILLDDPDFKMTKVERQADGLVKLQFQHRLVVGEFDCDPAANYVIRRGRSSEKGIRIECVMTFERHFGPNGPDGRVNLERLVYEVVDLPGSRRNTEITYSYPDVRKTGELDEEKFRLTAYGLPEPEGIVWEKPRRWLPYWLAGAGLMVILLTTWFLRKARRTRAEVKRP